MDRLSRAWVAFLAIGLALVVLPLSVMAESGGATRPPGTGSSGNCAPGRDCVARSFSADAGIGLTLSGGANIGGGVDAGNVTAANAVRAPLFAADGGFHAQTNVAGMPGLYVNGSNPGWPMISLATDGTTRTILGAARIPDDIVAGSLNGDTVLRTLSKQILFSVDNGTSITGGWNTSGYLFANARIGVGGVTAPTMSIDSSGNGIRHRGVATGSLPTCSSNEGGLAYDTTDKRWKFCNGTAWAPLPRSATGTYSHPGSTITGNSCEADVNVPISPTISNGATCTASPTTGTGGFAPPGLVAWARQVDGAAYLRLCCVPSGGGGCVQPAVQWTVRCFE